MSSQQFDKYIKEQFSGYAPDVHPRIWENIASRKEKKKPVGFWLSFYNNNRNRLLVAALLLSVTSGTTWWLYNQNNNNADNTQDYTAAPATSPATLKDHPGNVTAQQPIGDKENIAKGQTNASTQNETAVGTGIDKEVSLESSNNLSAKGRRNILINTPSLQTDNEEKELTDKPYSALNKKQKSTKDLLRIKTAAPGVQEEGEEPEEEPAIGGSLLGRLTYNAELITARKKAKNPLQLSLRQVNFLPDCPSLEKNAAGNKKYIEFFAGPDYAFRSLSDTGNSEYLRRRKESTKFSSAFSAGIRYTRVFKNSMSVRIGANYSQINEKFTFNQGNIVQVTYIIGSNGDTLGSFTTIGTRYKTTINRYRTLDIPIAMGYELGNGRWHANINAGVIVNVYSWQKGDVLDTAYNPVSITTGKSSSPYQFKTNAGIGFVGGVSVYYKLNDRIHLMAEPYFRYNFSPMNKDNITLKQKYQTAGLRIGIRLDL